MSPLGLSLKETTREPSRRTDSVVMHDRQMTESGQKHQEPPKSGAVLGAKSENH